MKFGFIVAAFFLLLDKRWILGDIELGMWEQCKYILQLCNTSTSKGADLYINKIRTNL